MKPAFHVLVLLACSLACIECPQVGLAQEQKPGVVAKQVRPVNPILIRNQHGPLLSVIIDVPSGTDTRLISMEFSFDGTEELDDIKAVQLFGTGDIQAFSPTSPIGDPVAPPLTLKIAVDRPLTKGRNVYWLSCRLNDSARLGHRVAATCTSITTSEGSSLP